MSIIINSIALQGLEAEKITVEADMLNELPNLVIVGLPDAAVQEAKERVKLAIRNSGFEFPRKRIIVNLAPADIRKEGPAFDLPIALAILVATNQINQEISDSIFIGELSLNGDLRSTAGVLPATIFAKNSGFKKIYIPAQNCHEATLVEGIDIYPIKNMSKLVGHLQKEKIIEPIDRKLLNNQFNITTQFEVDMSFVKGQEQAKRALEIAAAGGHKIIMSGPPGSGKTLLARTLPSIMPELTNEEILEVTKIYSVAGLLATETPIINTRPFRSPHHTSSGVALVGGGKYPKPGEITLAHRGILFLDEFPEFPRQVLENLRQPLEDGVISISRAQGTLCFPARFILVASQNPCPCGYGTNPDKQCACTPTQIIRYQKKVSGPLLDRIDLHVEVPRVNFDKLSSPELAEPSVNIRERVEKAREIQNKRFRDLPIYANSEMRNTEIREFCKLDDTSTDLLRSAITQMHLSARAYNRILKLSRTIADLSGNNDIRLENVAEALQYRQKE